jgi:HSP20 family protein
MLVPKVVPLTHPTWNIDRFLEGFFHDNPFGEFAEARAGFPSWNVSEDEASFRVEAELPGFARENLEIQVTGNELRLSGFRESKVEDKTKVVRRERFTGQFSRTLRVSVPVDADKVEAVFKDGILTVTLPKSEAALPRKIRVQDATKVQEAIK